MLLRTRVTLIVSITYSLLVAGLTFAGLKSEELADERYAQATLNGQEIFWRKLVENTVQRLETDARGIAGNMQIVTAVDHRDPAQTLVHMGPLAEAMKTRGTVSRLEILDRDGELLYSSRGSLLEPPILDAGTVRAIVDGKRPVRGVLQDASRTFTATLAFPLQIGGDEVAGIAVLAADMQPPLSEFQASTGSDIFLVDRNGHLAQGTNDALWSVFNGKISVRKSRLLTWAEGEKYYSVVVLPVQDGFNRVIGALVTARDVSETQARQRLIRVIAIGAVIGFLVLVLGIFYVYLRRSFHPLDEAIAVLNALSRGDTSVTLEVRNDKDEIGRIAGTVGVFRENTVKLDLMQQRRERQRRRQELFIRLQMLKLSEMLEEEARAAILSDMKQIEAMAERKAGSEDSADSGKGELEVLGVAFQTMSDRIREQHLSLETLIAERTREAEVLREALRTRDQLNALRQELDFARELQLSSLPQVFPPFPDRDEFQIHAAMVPAKEVGGDFYDFFLLDHHHLGIVIGDASGKGVPAAMFIAIARSLIKAVAPLSRSPGECLAFVNTMLSADNPQTLFATCFYAVVDTRSGEVAFCNAGHPPPLILRQGQNVDAIRDVSGVALGVMEDLEYDTGTFTIAPNDTIVLYTDGVTEAQDVSETLYDEPRLIQTLRGLGPIHPEQVIATVQRAVEAFVGDAPQFDDITMLSLRFDRVSVHDGGIETQQRRLMLTGFQGSGGDFVPESSSPPSPTPPLAPVPPPAPIAVSVSAVRAPAAPTNPPAKRPRIMVQPVPAPTPAPTPTPAPSAKVPVMAVSTAKLVKTDGAPRPPVVPVVNGASVTKRPRVVVQPPKPKPVPHTRLEVTIANDLDELARLAGLVDEFVERNSMPERISFNLNLCLDELITNIVSYGYEDGHHHDIHVKFALDNGRLITEIIDDGKEYNPFTDAPEPDLALDVDDRPIGGLGVFLVKEFMDRTDYRREGGTNIVTLEKNVTEQES
ncbi:SpoIIE family protein phosphatase [Magnetospirillum gryphiswaldense]|uniref:Stage II sporulation E n=1 Tax=Magnetospirillum gryphiswaldense TaxID=55518 RepID=A4U2P7_9PROT|nr:SpoIIE family protein phosphatase [Magnetospirillum gryphiswaldense]AVM74769.1 Phosphoserine phosphatase RsbU [Magnetospirillum gryphiswaldense MSR-1]AVM78672.1 Phosphoserine phosphatase RsbU [Magnetospirillum gryphiswaldense]CAM77154.1 Stage II sporulation E [Magnetospirillum gryphiswaldense MSR-1]